MTKRLSLLGIGFFLLSACSAVAPIVDDAPPQLWAGMGIAALEFRSTGQDSQITLVPVSGSGGKLYIPTLPVGEKIVLFVTPMGRYCMRQFKAFNHVFTAKDDDQCFDVVADKLSYGGTFSPHVGLLSAGQGGGMSQVDDFAEFAELLKRQFPNIAAAYLKSN